MTEAYFVDKLINAICAQMPLSKYTRRKKKKKENKNGEKWGKKSFNNSRGLGKKDMRTCMINCNTHKLDNKNYRKYMTYSTLY